MFLRTIALILFNGTSLIAWSEPLQVAVASSFYPSAKSLAQTFSKQSGVQVNIISGSTGKLYLQIVNGAPFAVFMGADAKASEQLIADRLAIATSKKVYARGQLALWWPKSAEALSAWRNKLVGKRVTIANPKTAPYGRAAEEFLSQADLWGAWQKQLITGKSVAQSFQLIASGQVEAGLVPVALLMSHNIPRSQWVKLSDAPQLDQTMVLLTTAKDNAAASAWMDFVSGHIGQKIISEQGFDTQKKVAQK